MKTEKPKRKCRRCRRCESCPIPWELLPEIETARVAYGAYCESVGGKAFNGDTLPEFSQTPERIQNAWVAVVKAINKTQP